MQVRSRKQVQGEPDDVTHLHTPFPAWVRARPDDLTQGREPKDENCPHGWHTACWKRKRGSKAKQPCHKQNMSGGIVSTGARPLALQTCVVPPLHGAVMIAHSIQVIDVVLRVPPESVGPSPWRPMGWQTPAALASLNHVRCHVQASQRELHHVLKFHTLVSFL